MSLTQIPERTLRLNRSELAVPASNPRYIDAASRSAADVVFLDLEDAVAPGEKDQARKQAIEALQDIDWTHRVVSVRINGLDTSFMYRDVVDVVEQAGEKLDLLMHLFRDDLERVTDTALDELPADLPLADAMLQVFEAAYDFYAADPALARTFVKEMMFVNLERQAALFNTTVRYLNRLGQVVEAAKQRGEVHADVPHPRGTDREGEAEQDLGVVLTKTRSHGVDDQKIGVQQHAVCPQPPGPCFEIRVEQMKRQSESKDALANSASAKTAMQLQALEDKLAAAQRSLASAKQDAAKERDKALEKLQAKNDIEIQRMQTRLEGKKRIIDQLSENNESRNAELASLKAREAEQEVELTRWRQASADAIEAVSAANVAADEARAAEEAAAGEEAPAAEPPPPPPAASEADERREFELSAQGEAADAQVLADATQEQYDSMAQAARREARADDGIDAEDERAGRADEGEEGEEAAPDVTEVDASAEPPAAPSPTRRSASPSAKLAIATSTKLIPSISAS